MSLSIVNMTMSELVRGAISYLIENIFRSIIIKNVVFLLEAGRFFYVWIFILARKISRKRKQAVEKVDLKY